MEKLSKAKRRKIYEQALIELNPAINESLCLNHFNKHFRECVQSEVFYGCNGREKYGSGQLIEFEAFSNHTRFFNEHHYSIDDNDERIFILQLCIEMTK